MRSSAFPNHRQCRPSDSLMIRERGCRLRPYPGRVLLLVTAGAAASGVRLENDVELEIDRMRNQSGWKKRATHVSMIQKESSKEMVRWQDFVVVAPGFQMIQKHPH